MSKRVLCLKLLARNVTWIIEVKDIFLDCLRFIFISFEIVVLLVVLLVYLNWPDIFAPVGTLLISKEIDKLLFPLLGSPVAGLVFGYKISKELIAPPEAKDELKKTFYEWPGFSKLRNRVFFSLVLCGFAFVINIVLWLFAAKLDATLIGFLFALVNVLWFVSIISLAIGNLFLKAILGGER